MGKAEKRPDALKKKKAEWPADQSRNLPNWETENGDRRWLV
jgi:hypothetical protein